VGERSGQERRRSTNSKVVRDQLEERRRGGRMLLASISRHRLPDRAQLHAATINISMNRARDSPCSTTRRAGELSGAGGLSIRRGADPLAD